MCHVVDRAARVQDKNSDLLQGLMSTLSVSFDSMEVVTYKGKKRCTSALSRIASLSGEGYLRDKDDSQQFVNLVSQYAELVSASSGRRRLQSAVYPVTSVVRRVGDVLHVLDTIYQLYIL
jgi:hypothetical protein